MSGLTMMQQAEVVEGYTAGQSTLQIAARFGVTRQCIGNTLRRNGVTMRTLTKLTVPQKREIADRYVRGQGTARIAESVDVSEVTVLKVLHTADIAIRGGRCKLRHDALDVLTPEVAYWCGFLFADGSVYRREGYQPVISVAVAAPDRDHLVKLRAFLGSTHMVGIRPDGSYQLRMTSARLAVRLLELGRYEGRIAPDLAASRDFWRGVVDGDGSLGFYRRRRSDLARAQFRLCGEHRLLTAFLGFLREDGTTGARLSIRPHKTIYNVGTTGASAARIVTLLYGNAKVSLSRKADIADLIVAKHRNGPTAVVTVAFQGHYSRFVDMAPG